MQPVKQESKEGVEKLRNKLLATCQEIGPEGCHFEKEGNCLGQQGQLKK